jgi:hypothetical protein
VQNRQEELAALAGKRERIEAMERDRDLIFESYAALAPGALNALSPEERRKVYVILNLAVEPLANAALQISGAFGEEPVWEDVGTSRRYSFCANTPPAKSFRFALSLREGAPPETSFQEVGSDLE